MLRLIPLLLFFAAWLPAQCQKTIALGTSGRSAVIDNRTTKCSSWTLTFTISAGTTTSVSLQAADAVQGPWYTFPGTAASSASGTIRGSGSPAYVSVSRTPAGTGMVSGLLVGVTTIGLPPGSVVTGQDLSLPGNVKIGTTVPGGYNTLTTSPSTPLMPPVTTITTTVSGQAAQIEYLSTTNIHVPTPLVIYFHGNTEDQTYAFTDVNEKSITNAYIAAGYIVASSNGGGSLWGSQAAQDAYYNLYAYLAGAYSISRVIFVGQSMGGLTSLNLIASGRVPVVAWYGIYPVTNLLAAYASGVWTSALETIYSCVGPTACNAAMAAYDPNSLSWVGFQGVRYRMTASYSDTFVPRTTNSDAIVARWGTHAPATVITATGNHGDTSHFIPLDHVAFAAQSDAVFYGNSLYNSDFNTGLIVRNLATPTLEIQFGYDATLDAGYIQSHNRGIGLKPLRLNPVGGVVQASGGSANKAMCWKADAKTLGYCSTVVDSTGACTCN